jgi:hypothetical protein
LNAGAAPVLESVIAVSVIERRPESGTGECSSSNDLVAIVGGKFLRRSERGPA